MIKMAKAGFDVWIGNVRGTRYGYEHDYLEYDSREYWDFSYYEQGIYDIPAMSSYVYNYTGGRKVSLFGYSQGSSNIMVSISERPEFHAEITNVAGLQAPCGVMNKTQSEQIYKPIYDDFFQANDIYTIGAGPRWEENY
jgi:lysosomal acid lipase/cholesteryl ester hydrolase